MAELVADSVVATSNATQAAKASAEEANAGEQGTVVDKIAEKISEADAVLEKAADAVKQVVVGGDASPSENDGKDTTQQDEAKRKDSPDNEASKSKDVDDHTYGAASDAKEQEDKEGNSDEDVESAEAATAPRS